MSEEDAVKRTTDGPVTVDSLAEELSELGVRPGMTLIAHTSLSSLGWVCGGAAAVVLALEKALSPEGTLVMTTFSGDLSDPAKWVNPPVPKEWWETIRQNMPAYDKNLTPTRGVGVVPECFRKQQGVLRSSHPVVSFAARGPHASSIIDNHPLDYPFGNGSPLSGLYDLDGWILLMSAEHRSNTSLHLAEHRADYPRKREVGCGAPIVANGTRKWVEYHDIELDETDFDAIGADFEREEQLVKHGKTGYAQAALMPQRPLVDFATKWMEKRR